MGVVPGLLAALLTVLPACTTPLDRPREMLDRDTGATVTSPAQPMLFTRSQKYDARAPLDYVTLVALDVNQNSRHERLLIAYGWAGSDASPAATLRIMADDQVLELQPDSRTARDFGIATVPHEPPRGFAGTPQVYRCELSAWQLLASSRALTIQMTSAGQQDSPRYVLWTDGRPALREMLAAMQP